MPECSHNDVRDVSVSTDDIFTTRTLRTVCIQTDRESDDDAKLNLPKKLDLDLISRNFSGKQDPVSKLEQTSALHVLPHAPPPAPPPPPPPTPPLPLLTDKLILNTTTKQPAKLQTGCSDCTVSSDRPPTTAEPSPPKPNDLLSPSQPPPTPPLPPPPPPPPPPQPMNNESELNDITRQPARLLPSCSDYSVSSKPHLKMAAHSPLEHNNGIRLPPTPPPPPPPPPAPPPPPPPTLPMNGESELNNITKQPPPEPPPLPPSTDQSESYNTTKERVSLPAHCGTDKTPQRKQRVEPVCPMKTLYWTRIQIRDNR